MKQELDREAAEQQKPVKEVKFGTEIVNGPYEPTGNNNNSNNLLQVRNSSGVRSGSINKAGSEGNFASDLGSNAGSAQRMSRKERQEKKLKL